ncbi:MAG: HD domain-containing protein [Thiotrichales bacterium]|nr:HD domain-containing protein [Thiotrichales bacterium]
MTINLPTALGPESIRIAEAIRAAGGRAIVVGGWVRDHLLGVRSKDVDIEVFGLRIERLEALLADFGRVHAVGRAFGVFRVGGIDVDFSLPRRDSKRGPGHRGFDVTPEPTLDFAEAARRRDLTVNSIGLDPLTGEMLDPHGGRRDLERRVLRATDPEHFPEDPLRGLRVAQFSARLEMTPDEELVALCRTLDLDQLSGERVFDEFTKLLLRAARPSIGFRFLEESGQLRFFPELDALRGVPQEPEWHPEGDVWVHTLMVLDAAAALRDGGGGPGERGRAPPTRVPAAAAPPDTDRRDADDRAPPMVDTGWMRDDAEHGEGDKSSATRPAEDDEHDWDGAIPSAEDERRPHGGDDDLALMFGALCHDLGKPGTTERIDGRVRSYRHDVAGVAPTRALLERMRAPGALIDRIAALVEHHLAPALFVKNRATAKGYRRLARKLERAGASIELLVRVARADHLGRTTADALAGRFDAGDAFLAAARAHRVEHAAPRDAVLGRHLVARGMPPGPGFAPILERCRELQDETGWTDPERILDQVLAEYSSPSHTH